MLKRRRFKQTSSLEDRLLKDTEQLQEKAKGLPPGPARDELVRKIRRNQTASHLSEWLRSPGLQPPK
ncbi:MAG: hypothetical protein KGK01_01550 [Bradyrhizobium sp.]|uniref:hypothetical protein n=1 Tax=Bradyrhizobium sp. TaxID=376 RepID=UPI0023958CB5|nr:hypothetical protein [Bradyrhizobium sp.]MDE2241150.1 hypothetical protein [Bradyrhizobium sp.]